MDAGSPFCAWVLGSVFKSMSYTAVTSKGIESSLYDLSYHRVPFCSEAEAAKCYSRALELARLGYAPSDEELQLIGDYLLDVWNSLQYQTSLSDLIRQHGVDKWRFIVSIQADSRLFLSMAISKYQLGVVNRVVNTRNNVNELLMEQGEEAVLNKTLEMLAQAAKLCEREVLS